MDTIIQNIQAHYAAENQKAQDKNDTLHFYIELDDPNATIEGLPALSYAASHADHEAVALLLSRGADPFGRAQDERTAFHALALGPNDRRHRAGIDIYHTAAALFYGGVKTDAADHLGKTASHLAAEAGCYELAFTLFSFGEAQNRPDSQGNTPLHTACLEARELEQRLAAMDATPGRGESLELRVRLEHIYEAAYVLLVSGLDLGTPNLAGETAGDILAACEGGKAVLERFEIPFQCTMTPNKEGEPLGLVQALYSEILAGSSRERVNRMRARVMH